MAALTVDQLAQQVRQKKLGPIYLFDGPENWLKNQWISKFESVLTNAETKTFNFEKFNGSTASAETIVPAINSLPFLSERRLIIVEDVDELSAADNKILSAELKDIPKTTCLVMLYNGKAQLREVLPATVHTHGSVVTFWTPFSNQLPSWLIQQSKERGKEIKFDAAQLLSERCDSLNELSQELDKLMLFVGKKNIITMDDLEAHGLPDEFGSTKDLEMAIYEKNTSKILQQLTLLFSVGLAPEALLPIFERIFRGLLVGQLFINQEGMSPEEAGKRAGIRGKLQLNQFNRAVRHYQQGELKRAFDKITEAHFQIKSGRLTGSIALTMMIKGIFPGNFVDQLAFRHR